LNNSDTAWVLVATALVLLMTPALAFFYGGLVRKKNALNTMMMSVCALGFVGLAWALVGYSLAFGRGNAGVGDLSMAFLRGVGLAPQGRSRTSSSSPSRERSRSSPPRSSRAPSSSACGSAPTWPS
jgi:ammonia channel protein AmtB